MSSLILELKQGEAMLLNGTVIRFKTRARLELTSHVRFLFGKQIMRLEDATTSARQVYYALQLAYAGEAPERPAALQRALELAGSLAEEAGQGGWAALPRLSAGGATLEALKLARQMVRAEDERQAALSVSSLASTAGTSG